MTTIPPSPPPIKRRMKPSGMLSFSQESLWFLQQLDPENNAYNLNHMYKFTGGVDRPSLERALNELIRRHEPLRTCYPNQGGRPVQIVQPFTEISLPYVDFSGLAETEIQQAVRQYAVDNGDQPYDLQHGPLMRAALLHCAPNEDILFLGMHHIGTDGWSQQVIFSDLMRLYDAFHSNREPDLPELPVQYSDYAAWQREWLSGDNLTDYINHWKEILSGELPIIELPTDRPRPMVQTPHGARYYFMFPPSLLSQIKSFCLKQRITLFHYFLAGYALMLLRYTGHEDIIIGCPFANRPRPELDGLVGLFVNTLPIRLNLSGNPSVQELLDQVRTVMLNAFSWQAAPFEALVSEISPERDLSRTPVFQVAINLRNVPSQHQTKIEGLHIETLHKGSATAPFDLSLEFDEEGGSLLPSLQYNVDLYDEKTIVHMASHYQNMLAEMLMKTDRPLSEMEMLTPSEKKRIVFDWNQTEMGFPQVCVHDLIAEQSGKNPNAIAVLCHGRSLTYRELDERANRLAQHLRNIGVEVESRVGIYLPRCEDMIVALLAVLKAGAAYVPLDLTYPSERIAYMVRDSDPAVIVTLSHLKSQLPDRGRLVCLDLDEHTIKACGLERPALLASNDSLIYVMYTSGSTGRPKGVMNIHRGLVNYFSYMKEQFTIGPEDRIIQLTSLSFDVSAFEILGILSCGGMIILMDDSQMRDPESILAAVVEHQATILSLVPTMLRALAECALSGEPRNYSLRLILPAGEALRTADVGLARRAFGDAPQLVNEYGPTECSIIHTTYPVPGVIPNNLPIVPIGKPIGNAHAYVLDKYLHPVPAGVTGDLYIGGALVGRGYWNQPELTAQQFLPDPFLPGEKIYRSGDTAKQLPDGTVCYLGRSDDQVKIRGYRVELKEIEATVNEFPGVKDAAVVLRQDDDRDKLFAYISLFDGESKFSIEDLQHYLKDRLPFYMLPTAILVLKAMPLTPNQKIDRQALPLLKNTEEQYHLAPRNEVEKRLVLIWQEVLGVEKVGIRDNFFELGGHSLLAVRLFSRIQEEFGQSLPLLLLFREGTVESLAASLNLGKHLPKLETCIPIHIEGSQPPLFCVSPTVIDVVTYRDLSQAIGPDQPFYALYTPRAPEQSAGGSSDPVDSFLEEVRKVQPAGPYYLAGYSRGGYFALRLAHRLQTLGEQVGFVILFDTYAPGFPYYFPWVTPRIANILLVLRRVQTYFWKFWILDWQGKRNLLLSKERPFDTQLIEWLKKRRKELQRKNKGKKPQPSSDGRQEDFQNYAGKLILLRARRQLPGTVPHPTLGWSTWLNRAVEVHLIPGDHESILFGPRVPGVADILRDCMAQVHRPRTESGIDS
jgi:amino acid adenylation domain-containing protein